MLSLIVVLVSILITWVATVAVSLYRTIKGCGALSAYFGYSAHVTKQRAC